MAAATRQGLDPEQIFWVLTRLAPLLKAREAGFLRKVHEPAMFAMRDMLKDLDLGLSLYQPVRGSGSTVPLTSLVRELFARVASQAPDLDLSAIVKAYSTIAAEPSARNQREA
jgi:3-hydroxyisobutyrate dehydrogenase-like beta-hydroxyacid dehydrogenase